MARKKPKKTTSDSSKEQHLHTDAEAHAEAHADVHSTSHTDAHVSDDDVDASADTGGDDDTSAGTDAADASAGASDSEPRSTPEAGRDAEADHEPDAEPGPDGEPHADPEPDAEPGPDADAEPDDATRLRTERDQWRDRHLRLAADFDNYRKRSDERMRTRWERAQADLVTRLLDPMDDLLRISELEPETSAAADAVLEGAALVERKFFRILEEAGVEVVDPAQGEPFDPNVMEAMMRVPTESEEEDDMVERVFQKGYVLKGQLLRPARVGVYKAG